MQGCRLSSPRLEHRQQHSSHHLHHGRNWTTYTSDDERQNAENNEMFVNTTYSEDNFDDQLLWLSPYVLFTRMVNAGRLP
jgi:hypothetical protein